MKEIFLITGSLLFVIGFFILRFKCSEKVHPNTRLLVRLLNQYCSDKQPNEQKNERERNHERLEKDTFCLRS